jgi:hypothetical protein
VGVRTPGFLAEAYAGWPSSVAWALPTSVVFRIARPASSCSGANSQAARPPLIPSRQQTSQDAAARSEAIAPVRLEWAVGVRPRLLKLPGPKPFSGQPNRTGVV